MLAAAYGIDGWENIDKEEIAKAIGEGRWREYGEAAVYAYCEEDVAQITRIAARSAGRLRTLRAPIDPRAVMRWSDYSAKSVARIQAKRHADRHAAVEPGAREQGGGHHRADPALRSQPGQRKSDLLARR